MLNSKTVLPFEIKVDTGKRTFSAYGNVKNVKDHALDIVIDGAYQKSITKHKTEGTMPKLLWAHDQTKVPVGGIDRMEEDSKGFLIDGRINKTALGEDVYAAAMDGDLDSFSIGYLIHQEEWDSSKQANLLKEIHIKEVSFVNFACCEPSLLQDIKSGMGKGELPTKREIEKLLREGGLSRKQAMAVVSQYKPQSEVKLDPLDLSALKLFN